MFRCTRAPLEPMFSPTLTSFAFHKSPNGEFLSTSTNQHFTFFHTSNDRVNDLRRGAFQEALRVDIAAGLKEQYGVTEVFLSGEEGRDVGFGERPKGKHVSLLMTERGS
ncbi:hypothetical protein Slin14017_G119930 [Septoria linicola]|nr:hypothetical protein Slin14017_G119930 [Septoria linicola]